MTDQPGTRTDVVRHKVGQCPACRDYLWAEVTIVATISAPSLSEEGRANVFANARPVAMTVTHTCEEPADNA